MSTHPITRALLRRRLRTSLDERLGPGLARSDGAESDAQSKRCGNRFLGGLIICFLFLE
jgi:hypothetical protein